MTHGDPVVIDIETVPTEAALATPYPEQDRTPPENYKKPEAIAGWRERDKAKWEGDRIKECSLNARLGRVLCVGWDLNGITDALVAPTEDCERDALQGFWGLIRETAGRVVTFNGRSFDLRFITLRSLAHGITPSIPTATVRDWFARYRVYPHCDVRDLLTNWDSWGDGTLTDWCAFLGVPCDLHGIEGSDVYRLYRAGDLDAIAAKCRTDVRATRDLYDRAAPMFAAAA